MSTPKKAAEAAAKAPTYVWYLRNLAAPGTGPFHDEPQPGYYRVRRAKGSREWDRVAIWWEQGEFRATREEKPVDPYQVWSWACRNPVDEDLWNEVKAGAKWPDAAPEPRKAVAGDNLPDDPAERAKLELQKVEKDFLAWLADHPIENELVAAQLAERKLILATARKEVEATRAKLKKPHDDASKAVQKVWKPLVDGYDALIDKAEDAARAYLIRKREEEKLAAAAASAQDGVEYQPERARIGNTGAVMGLSDRKYGKITDMAAFLTANVNNTFLIDAAQKVANALARAGTTCAGMEIATETKVR